MGTNFKENLRAELDYAGLTVKELSAKTGIAKGTLDCYLGVRASMPPADIAEKIASALGVSVEYLINGHSRQEKYPLKPIPDSRTILKNLETLNNRDKTIVYNLIRSLAETEDSERRNN